MHRYEQLEVWTRSVRFAARLHLIARSSTRWADQSMWNQISRAAVSIPANIAEGAQRGTDREFIRFLGIAMGSAAELQTILALALQSGVLDAQSVGPLTREARELRQMTSALRGRLLSRARKKVDTIR
jgi:four helix bundle protein